MTLENSILDAIINYGFETIVIAVAINLLTAILKIPIKSLANTRADGGTSIKKYITFLPIILGFALAIIYTILFGNRADLFNSDFITLWLTSSSLSLAIYAIVEKFITKKEGDIVFSDEMMYKAYRLIESLSGIDDTKDLRTLTKLIYNKFNEFNAIEGGDYHLIEDVLRGLIPSKSLEAVSIAVYEMLREKIKEENQPATVKETVIEEKTIIPQRTHNTKQKFSGVDKIILKGGK